MDHHDPQGRKAQQAAAALHNAFNTPNSGNMPQFNMAFDPLAANGMQAGANASNPLQQTIMSLQQLSNQFRAGNTPSQYLQSNATNHASLHPQMQQPQCMFPTGNNGAVPSWSNYLSSPQQQLDPMTAFLNQQHQPTHPKLANNNTGLNSMSQFDLLMSPTLGSASQLLPANCSTNRQLFNNSHQSNSNMNSNSGSMLYPNAPTPAFTQPYSQHAGLEQNNLLAGYLPMQQQTVDTVEEVVAHLGRDYTIDNDLVMNDYANDHEHLYHDAFLGAAPQQPPERAHAIAGVPLASSSQSVVQSNSNGQCRALAAGNNNQMNSLGHAGTSNEANDPASLIHSIFDFDPESLAAPSTSGTAFDTEQTPEKYNKEDSTDASLTPSAAAALIVENTPRHKEKIKQRRDRELEEIDRAFDRHLSMVAEKNARAAARVSAVHLPSLPTAMADPLQQEQPQEEESPRTQSPQPSTSTLPPPSRAGTSLMMHRPNMPLSPARFSPARFSPEQGKSPPPAEMLFGLPPTNQEQKDDIQVFIPADDNKKNKRSKKKLPVYCLALSPKSSSTLPGMKLEIDVVNDVPPPKTAEDAYDFDDFDDEPVIPESVPVTPHHKKGTRSNTQAARSAGSVKDDGGMKSPMSDTGSAGDLWRHVVPKKRHAPTDHKTGPAAPLLPPDAQSMSGSNKASTQTNTPREKTTGELMAERLTDTINNRRKYRVMHNYVLSEVQSCKQTVTVPGTLQSAKPANKVTKPVNSAKTRSGAGMRTNTLGQTQPVVDLTLEQPAIPKVVIRIPKLFAAVKQEAETLDDESEEARRARKKKHKKEKKKKKRSKRDKSVDSLGSCQDPSLPNGQGADCQDSMQPPGASQSASSLPHFSKKRRIMDEWAKDSESLIPAGDTSILNGDDNSNDRFSVASSSQSHKTNKEKSSRKHRHRRKHEKTVNYEVFISEDPLLIATRLSHFQMPLETLQKGQFVVAKCDLDDAECPLWKVDNQNLLQKFPPEDHRGQILYRNSSTYAGWCQQNAYRYVSVSVRFIKHSRSEWLVQPETPLIDLLPAVLDTIDPEEPVLEDDTKTVQDGHTDGTAHALGNTSDIGLALGHNDVDSADQPIRDALETYLHALLMQCLNQNFLDTIRANNDYKYLRHINDINQLNEQKMQRLLVDVRWSAELRHDLDTYTHCRALPLTHRSLPQCQACDTSAVVSDSLQLFGDAAYDRTTFQPKLGRRSIRGSPIPAQEYGVCSKCSANAQAYHNLTHITYVMYQAAEAQIDSVRAENERMEPSTVLDECLRNRAWMAQVVCDVLRLWRNVSDQSSLLGS